MEEVETQPEGQRGENHEEEGEGRERIGGEGGGTERDAGVV